MYHKWIMEQIFVTMVLALAVLLGLLTAWSSGAAPAKFAEDLGLSIINAGGRNEIMAQYTCLFLAMAAVCAAALVGAVPRQAALIVLAVIFGGLLVGRLVSLPLNGGIAGYSRTIVSLYAIDAVGLALTAAALVLNNYG